MGAGLDCLVERTRRSGKAAATLRLGWGQMTATSPNFVLLDSTRPDIAILAVAMLQARDVVERRSWSHPQEPTGEEWWATCLPTLALAGASGAPT
jgi:hypothetical protein